MSTEEDNSTQDPRFITPRRGSRNQYQALEHEESDSGSDSERSNRRNVLQRVLESGVVNRFSSFVSPLSIRATSRGFLNTREVLSPTGEEDPDSPIINRRLLRDNGVTGEVETGEETEPTEPVGEPTELTEPTVGPEPSDQEGPEDSDPEEDSVSEEERSDCSSGSSSISSISTMGSSSDEKLELDAAALKAKMEVIQSGSTKVVTEKPDYAQFVRFRTTMVLALRDIPNPDHDLGYSYLADSTDGYRKKMGSKTADPPEMPLRPDKQNKFHKKKHVRDEYKSKEREYFKCMKVRNAGIEVLEATYPECLALLREDDEEGLSLATTLKSALEFVLSSIDTPQSKRKAALRLKKEVMEVAYKHKPKSNECVKFFKKLRAYKTDVDNLEINADGEPSLLPIDDLILMAQEAL